MADVWGKGRSSTKKASLQRQWSKTGADQKAERHHRNRKRVAEVYTPCFLDFPPKLRQKKPFFTSVRCILTKCFALRKFSRLSEGLRCTLGKTLWPGRNA
eukprot:1336047-Amorphochlora_amoeboformis.AAC.1